MIFWESNDLTHPPKAEDLRRRRPTSKNYWESRAASKQEALQNFWLRWERETGKKVPKELSLPPRHGDDIGFAGSRTQGSRRPDKYAERAKLED